jgi:hypothetical protein
MCPCFPFHSELGAERTNSASNLRKRNNFQKSIILNILACLKFNITSAPKNKSIYRDLYTRYIITVDYK